MVTMLKHVFWSFVISSVAASPLPEHVPQAQGLTCNNVNALLNILRAPAVKSAASSYCSALLKSPRTTVIATVVPTVVPGLTTTTLPDSTTTVSTTSTTFTTTTSTITAHSANPTNTATSTFTAGTKTIWQRDLRPRQQVPPALNALRVFASSAISSACSCVITVSTSTSYSTSYSTSTSSSTQTVGPLATVSVTNTATATVTITNPATTTLAPTSTVTTTTVTTVTPILVKPKICNAQGLPGANAFNYDANFNSNQAACIASCKPDNRCLSTGFYLVTDPSTGTTTGTCRKYDKSVQDTADLGSGYYNFNDKAC